MFGVGDGTNTVIWGQALLMIYGNLSEFGHDLRVPAPRKSLSEEYGQAVEQVGCGWLTRQKGFVIPLTKTYFLTNHYSSQNPHVKRTSLPTHHPPKIPRMLYEEALSTILIGGASSSTTIASRFSFPLSSHGAVTMWDSSRLQE